MHEPRFKIFLNLMNVEIRFLHISCTLVFIFTNFMYFALVFTNLVFNCYSFLVRLEVKINDMPMYTNAAGSSMRSSFRSSRSSNRIMKTKIPAITNIMPSARLNFQELNKFIVNPPCFPTCHAFAYRFCIIFISHYFI